MYMYKDSKVFNFNFCRTSMQILGSTLFGKSDQNLNFLLLIDLTCFLENKKNWNPKLNLNKLQSKT